ncbi:hypothetical protein [Ruminococcus sp.]|uniref:hypothetical protein n=1 Tax=Ruminococcus sp. TaxID=41978 RepID=UPI00386CC168
MGAVSQSAFAFCSASWTAPQKNASSGRGQGIVILGYQNQPCRHLCTDLKVIVGYHTTFFLCYSDKIELKHIFVHFYVIQRIEDNSAVP